MKCPKCGYVTHDYLDACRKCHADWVAFKQEIHLEAIQPGDLDLSLALSAHGDNIRTTGTLGAADDFLDTQVYVEPEEPLDDEFDIHLGDDDAAAAAVTEAATPPAEVTDAAAEDESADFTLFSDDDDEDEAFIDLTTSEEIAREAPRLDFTDGLSEGDAHPPVDPIDMTDLVDLDAESLAAFEEAAQGAEAAAESDTPPPASEATPVSDEVELDVDDLPGDRSLEVTLALPDMPFPEPTPDVPAAETPAAPPPTEPEPEVVPEPDPDDVETELMLEVEDDDETPTPPPPTPPSLDIDETESEMLLELEDLEIEDDDEKP